MPGPSRLTAAAAQGPVWTDPPPDPTRGPSVDRSRDTNYLDYSTDVHYTAACPACGTDAEWITRYAAAQRCDLVAILCPACP